MNQNHGQPPLCSGSARPLGDLAQLEACGGENLVGAKSCMSRLEVGLSKTVKEMWTRFMLDMI